MASSRMVWRFSLQSLITLQTPVSQVVIYNHMKLQAIKAKVAAGGGGKDEEKAKGTTGGGGGSEPHEERCAN